MDHEESSAAKELNLQTALTEVQIASPDLADFLIWTAQHGGDIDPAAHEDFSTVVKYVLAYAKVSNQESADETASQTSG